MRYIMKNKISASKKKNSRKGITALFLYFFVSLLVGIGIGFGMDGLGITKRLPGSDVWRIVIFLLSIYGSIILHVIIHESGHLIFGLLYGFRFLSFRIGPVMLLKKEGRYRLKRYSIAGTGGQCVMEPPVSYEEAKPYVWYLLGGCIFNLLFSFLGILLLVIGKNNAMWAVFCMMFSVVGMVSALLNGLPIKGNMVPNDGYNVRAIRKDPVALYALWIQLTIAAAVGKGDVRMKDMPAEWFHLPSDADLHNPLISSVLVFAENRAMDQHDFESAREWIRKTEQPDCETIEIYRALLEADKLFMEILEKKENADVSALKDPDIRKILRAMKNNPSVIRTQYAVEACVNKDEKAARAHLEYFEKIAKNYPFPCDIAAERELMELCR